jgi:hypothetical protein
VIGRRALPLRWFRFIRQHFIPKIISCQRFEFSWHGFDLNWYDSCQLNSKVRQLIYFGIVQNI